MSTDLFRENGLSGTLPVQYAERDFGAPRCLRLGASGADTLFMACPFLETCSMFCTIMADDETEYLAWAFCRTVYQDCGRYKKAISGQEVPEGLLPTGDLVVTSEKK